MKHHGAPWTPISPCLGPSDYLSTWVPASQVALVVKNLPANAGDIRDGSSIPRWGRFLQKGIATHYSILAWKIPWTEEPSGVTKSRTRWKRWSTRHIHHCHKCPRKQGGRRRIPQSSYVPSPSPLGAVGRCKERRSFLTDCAETSLGIQQGWLRTGLWSRPAQVQSFLCVPFITGVGHSLASSRGLQFSIQLMSPAAWERNCRCRKPDLEPYHSSSRWQPLPLGTSVNDITEVQFCTITHRRQNMLVCVCVCVCVCLVTEL